MEFVALRLQQLSKRDQTLVLSGIAEGRSPSGRFGTAAVVQLFDNIGLQQPKKISNVFAALEKADLLSRKRGTGEVWRLTPKGRAVSGDRFTDLEISELLAESLASAGAVLGSMRHPLVPYSLAPPELTEPLSEFLANHPFDRNVFGMTRYPEQETSGDPIAPALAIASSVCSAHGLEFHLAMDRSISDDLWANIAGHMWGSRYGIGFFENRRETTLNPNLAIEIGSMLMTGRRCALIKDITVKKMPTDLVGKIYREVDLDAADTVERALHAWIRDDLRLGPCAECPGGD